MPCRNPRALPLTNSLPPDDFERPPARARRCLREGAAVVEFALLLPFIFLLLAGILEMGRLMEAQQTLSNAAREGARHAIRIDAETADVQQLVDDYLKGAGISGHTVRVETPAGAGSGDLIAVSVSVPYTNVSLLPAHSLQWLENKTLIASATLRKEKALTQGTASGSSGGSSSGGDPAGGGSSGGGSSGSGSSGGGSAKGGSSKGGSSGGGSSGGKGKNK